MRITDIEAKLYRAPLVTPFKIALGEISHIETVLVRITTQSGLTGFGEASAYAPVTGCNHESTLAFVRSMAPGLTGCDASDLAGVHAAMAAASLGQSAAKAGIDIALHDIVAKRAGLPLYRLLGGACPTLQTDMTIALSTPDEMSAKARAYVAEGYRILKVKAGLNPAQDVENLRAIRTAVGPKIQLRLDANQGWDVKGTLWALGQMEALGLDEVEQPLPHWNLDGMRFIRQRAAQQVMLDESVHSPADALRAVKAEAGDIINIKLMKSAGLYPAVKINAIAEAAGLKCMVGCMMETRIAIAAGAHLAAALPNIQLADLDSYTELADEGCVAGGFERKGDMLTLSEAPGLGIQLDFDAL